MPRTRAGLIKTRALGPGGRIAIVAPASPFRRTDFDAGIAELRRLGFEPVFEDRVFERTGFVAGSAESRAGELRRAWMNPDVDGILAVRGGYGSIEVLPYLSLEEIRSARKALIGYSDATSLHVLVGCHAGVTSIHGPMLEGRLGSGPAAYDPASFLRSLSADSVGELAPDGLTIVQAGQAAGPLFGGTLTQLVASLGTPFDFRPPSGSILLVDEVGERPYRLRRMLTQLAQSGRLAQAAGVLIGQLPGCDEPGGAPAALDVLREFFVAFSGPVVAGFPTGHSTSPLVSLPLGVHAQLIAQGRPRLVLEEAAAA